MIFKMGLISILSAVSVSAFATPAEVEWPSRKSKVVCGGAVDGSELEMSTIPFTQIMKAESADARVLIYLDFSKVGRARVLIAEVLTDEDYEARELILSKLPPEEAALLRNLSTNHFFESYVGFTTNFIDLRMTFGKKFVSLSCQEILQEEPSRAALKPVP